MGALGKVALGLWAAAVLAGFAALTRYKQTPGAAQAGAPSWPEASDIELERGRATVIMFAHPKCPCTRASLDELANVVRAAPDAATVYVAFMKPPSGEGWENSDLWQKASAIPGVRVRVDADGREAARFGASVSGEALLYGADGALAFQGGITAARGHAGDSLGRQRLIALLTGGSADRHDAPTFGCGLATRRNP
jgi:hypothetical protein